MKILTIAVLCGFLCACKLPNSQVQQQQAPGDFPGAASAASAPVQHETRGAFDYYLLTLSWAPEFCHNKPDNPECSGHFGFIVHGLWPQYRAGGYPQDCGSAPGLANVNAAMDIMPDAHLIDHEWQKHGTCTGLSADEYFALIHKIYKSVHVPSEFVNTSRQITMSPADIKNEFTANNPGITPGGMAVSCGSGPYFVGVEICFTKDGQPTLCGRGIQDCQQPMLRIPRIQ